MVDELVHHRDLLLDGVVDEGVAEKLALAQPLFPTRVNQPGGGHLVVADEVELVVVFVVDDDLLVVLGVREANKHSAAQVGKAEFDVGFFRRVEVLGVVEGVAVLFVALDEVVIGANEGEVVDAGLGPILQFEPEQVKERLEEDAIGGEEEQGGEEKVEHLH